MTTKTKKKVSIAIIVLSTIILIVSLFGIFLSVNRSYNFKGKVAFVSSNIEATITKASIEGGVLIDDSKMQQIEVDGLISAVENVGSWTELDLKLLKDSKDIEIRFNIINHSKNKTLKVELGRAEAKLANASISMRFDGMDTNQTTTYIARAKTDNQGVVTEEYFRQVVVTLHLNNKNKDAKIEDFNFPIVLKSVDAYVVNLSSENVDGESRTMAYTDINANELQLNNSLELCGNLITIVNQTEYGFYYSLQINDQIISSHKIEAGKNLSIEITEDSEILITSIVKA